MVTTWAKANVMQDRSSASSARCLRLSAAFLSGALRAASLAVSAVVRAPGGGGGGGMGTWGSRSSATHTASVMICKVKPQNVMYLQGSAVKGGEGAEAGGVGTRGSRSSATHTASVMICKVKPQNVMYLQGSAGEGGTLCRTLCICKAFQAWATGAYRKAARARMERPYQPSNPLRMAPLATHCLHHIEPDQPDTHWKTRALVCNTFSSWPDTRRQQDSPPPPPHRLHHLPPPTPSLTLTARRGRSFATLSLPGLTLAGNKTALRRRHTAYTTSPQPPSLALTGRRKRSFATLSFPGPTLAGNKTAVCRRHTAYTTSPQPPSLTLTGRTSRKQMLRVALRHLGRGATPTPCTYSGTVGGKVLLDCSRFHNG